MPIPDFNSDGLLPAGIFICTMPEIRTRFGTFQGSEQRPRLYQRLQELVNSMQVSGWFSGLILDGSFITAKPAPNDIDLIALLRDGQNFERDLTISEYALLSRTLLRRRFGFDVIIAEQDSSLYNTYVDFFSRVRESPELRKGLLRLLL